MENILIQDVRLVLDIIDQAQQLVFKLKKQVSSFLVGL